MTAGSQQEVKGVASVASSDRTGKKKAKTGRRLRCKLTAVQKIQVKIIDAKRCSIRFLLVISYSTLLHFIAFVTISLITYQNFISKHDIWLKYIFLGFLAAIILIFYGCSLALDGITYHWKACQFTVGIIFILITVLITFGLFSSTFVPGVIEQTKSKWDTWEALLCRWTLLIAPVSLSLPALVCATGSCIAAGTAIKIIPKQLEKGEVDAAWLEPYGTYDFYLGRNIPRVPGYDEVFEDVHTPVIEYYYDSDSPSETETGVTSAPSIAQTRPSNATTITDPNVGPGTSPGSRSILKKTE